MFDSKLEDFVKEIGIKKLKRIVLDCPEGYDTYLKSSGKYIKRSNKAYYSSDEVNVDDLGYISLVTQGVSCGNSFKDRLYEKRAKDLLNNIGWENEYET